MALPRSLQALALAVAVVCGSIPLPQAAAAQDYRFTRGWDLFDIPAHLGQSGLRVWVLAGRHNWELFLAGMEPNTLYQFGIHVPCSTAASSYRNHPFSACIRATRDGRTRWVRATEFAVLLTDRFGNARLRWTLARPGQPTPRFNLHIRRGAGCDILGGDPGRCAVAFRYPALFADWVRGPL